MKYARLEMHAIRASTSAESAELSRFRAYAASALPTTKTCSVGVWRQHCRELEVHQPCRAGLHGNTELTLQYDHAYISALAKRLRDNIMSRVDMVMLNGDMEGYPGCTNLTFQYIEGESLLMALKDICLSSGSACTSASLEPSYVLRALGLDDENAHSSLRFGIGRFTTEAEVDFVCDKIVQVVTRLRELSPLWEMVQEGIDLKTIQWSG